MHPFITLDAIPAPLPIMNVDTDMIISKLFLRTIKRTGLGIHLFDEMRFDDDKKEIPSFVLNKDPYRTAQILISGENFGCGSSREHAPWALLDFGFRCIIAPSFADIFYNNCFKNGILPIALPHDAVDQLMDYATNTPLDLISIDLPNQRVTTKNGLSFAFDIDSFKKTCLLEGLDDIGLTLAHADHLKTYEANNQADKPWLWG